MLCNVDEVISEFDVLLEFVYFCWRIGQDLNIRWFSPSSVYFSVQKFCLCLLHTLVSLAHAVVSVVFRVFT